MRDAREVSRLAGLLNANVRRRHAAEPATASHEPAAVAVAVLNPSVAMLNPSVAVLNPSC